MRSLPARRLTTVAALTTGSVLALAAPAFAHVTVQPGNAQAGGYTAVAFRVPDESDTAGTTKLEVTVPTDHPVTSVSTQPLPGWTATVEKSKLATPVKSAKGAVITDAVSKITWTADAGTKIGPGQFQEFRISLGPLPTDTDKLVFKALQTYDDGNVVRWIDEAQSGQPEPQHPAPTLTLTKADAASPAAGGHQMGGSGSQDATVSVGAARSDDSTARTLGVVGIVVGVIGAGLGVLGLRRKSSVTP